MSKSLWGILLGVMAVAMTILFWPSTHGAAVATPTQQARLDEPSTPLSSPQVTVSASTTRSPQPRVLVVDIAGAPIPGAEVCVARAESRHVYFTNQRGEAVLDDCAAGTQRIWVTRSGYLGLDSRMCINAQEVAQVTLRRFAKMSGTVTNMRGEAVPGAVVQLKYEAEDESRGRFIVTPDDNKLVLRGAVSGADGHFQIPRVIPSRAVILHALHPGFARATQSMPALGPEETIDVEVELPDHTGIRGMTALGTSSNTVVTLNVWHMDSERHFHERLKEFLTADREPFELRDIPVGETLIVAIAPDVSGVILAAAQVTVERGKMVDVGMLSPAPSVLKICCEFGSLSAVRQIQLGVRVQGLPKPMTFFPCDVVVTSEAASDYRIAGLPNGQALVDARILEPTSRLPDMRFCSATERISLDGDDEVKLVISERRPPTGLVVNIDPPPGTPKEILSAFLWLEDERGILSAFSRAAVGTTEFQFQNLSVGKRTLRAVAGGYTLTRSGLDLLPEQTTTISVSDWTVGVPCDGIVIDEAGNPVAAASVAFSAPSSVSDQKYCIPLIQDVSTDVEGRFSLGALPLCKGLQVAAWTSNTRSHPCPLSAGSASGVVLKLKRIQR